MKTLCLIRHAKSSWDDIDQSDFERSLNEKGLEDAPAMGKYLNQKKIFPDLIISSPAKRALTTAQIFADQLNYPKTGITCDSRIYEAATRDLMEVTRAVDDSYDTLFLFGHNPGITNYANLLGDQHISGLPTCAVVVLELKIDSWKNTERHTGKTAAFVYPRKIKTN